MYLLLDAVLHYRKCSLELVGAEWQTLVTVNFPRIVVNRRQSEKKHLMLFAAVLSPQSTSLRKKKKKRKTRTEKQKQGISSTTHVANQQGETL